MMTRRLISAERDWTIAYEIFRKNNLIDQSDRLDIPVIPRCILRQRLVLQKALILKEYNKLNESQRTLQHLLKLGKIYDPGTRKIALKHLLELLKRNPNPNETTQFQIKEYETMMKLFKNDKNKNIIFCIDALKDANFEFKKHIG